ncbi:hypothetical protein OU798_19815 [Prolixibacteraceae bacterium Z1-6]|uniref:NIPSNAP domain-containing protein n=1 Tax=Draconibacterium aestuarii TaxID=2998507 RepID=A0A9X3J822_9BACT|nr:hypothetical protein [Prolixibacteraceae bacterium Z1-6]
MKKLLAVTTVLLLVATIAMAQDDMKPVKHENVTWHNVVKVDFKPGQVWRAKEIIKIYEAAGAEAGTPGPEKFWFETGKYDLMLIWKMEDGPSDMEWRRSERNIKWRKALIEQLGSEEKVKELQQEYSGLISSSTNEICRKEIN